MAKHTTRGAEWLRKMNAVTDARADETAYLLAWAKLRAYVRRKDAARFGKEVRHG